MQTAPTNPGVTAPRHLQPRGAAQEAARASNFTALIGASTDLSTLQARLLHAADLLEAKLRAAGMSGAEEEGSQ